MAAGDPRNGAAMKKNHIDDVQPATVDEHFELILKDRTVIDPEFREVTPDDLPEWFDEKLFKTGQSYYMENKLAFGVANLTGLIAILSVPEILEILVFTNQSSTTCAAFRRYTQTLLHIYSLFYSDVRDPSSKYYKSVNVIRWKHATTTRRSTKEGLHGIYQKDMAITQFGFVGYVMICPLSVGLTIEPEKREAFNHFWRVTGHMLGISDRINICRKTELETTELCKRVAYEIIAKHMEHPSPQLVQLETAAVDGMWHLDVTQNTDAFLALTYNLTGLEYKKPLSLYSRWNLNYRKSILYLCTVPYVGVVVRTFYNYLITVVYWFAEHSPIIAWAAFGKQNSRIHLYPKLK